MSWTPAFPLGTSYLPGDAVVLRVFEPRYVALVNHVMSTDELFVSALISSGSEVGGGDNRFNIGVLVRINRIETADIGYSLFGQAIRIVGIDEWNDDEVYPRVKHSAATMSAPDAADSENLADEIRVLAHQIEAFFEFLQAYDISPPVQPDVVLSLVPQNLHLLASTEILDVFWTLARLLPASAMARYELLIPQSLQARIQRASEEIEHMSDIVKFRYGS